MMIHKVCGVTLACLLLSSTLIGSDPCGMVPPIYTGPGIPIARTGLQQTYVFYHEGVESFVIRPGFQGRVDNFGMLIPFPSVPALRKVPDNVFEQIANAIDPPEVVVDVRPELLAVADSFESENASEVGGGGLSIRRNEVRVLKEEAVGMYEVAVLEAGSPAALKRWMDKNKFQYPEGMDRVVADYVREQWCFVAVKTRVGAKAAADPKPGQRNAKPELPQGGVFDGNVQGLGFRFKTEELVVPMRLSAFNAGDLRNVVYLLTTGAKKIRSIPQEYVVRQVFGGQLERNLTQPLPLRIIGGKLADIPNWRKKGLDQERDPQKVNGVAKYLFASDILATNLEGYSHEFEETEKELLQIGEYFGLRGKEIDLEIEAISGQAAEKMVAKALPALRKMTMTVVDGDFPRDVIANQNLTFERFRMAHKLNRIEFYDTKQHKPGGKKEGILISSYSPDYDSPMDAKSQTGSQVAFASLGVLGLLAWLAIRVKTKQ